MSTDRVVVAGDKKADKVSITIAVAKKTIANLLCCGFEGGIGYWCPRQPFKYVEPGEWQPIMDTGEEDPERWEMYDYPLLAGGAVIFKADDGTGKVKKCRLDLDTIQKGLELMASKYPHHFGDVINGSEDATTGDVFIQLCAFGEVVYG